MPSRLDAEEALEWLSAQRRLQHETPNADGRIIPGSATRLLDACNKDRPPARASPMGLAPGHRMLQGKQNSISRRA